MESTSNPQKALSKRQGQVKKKEDKKALYKALFYKPISRRLAATIIGYEDQTFMVTQTIFDWIKQGLAQVVKSVKCPRSGRMVQGVTTNPDYFKKSNQLKLF